MNDLYRIMLPDDYGFWEILHHSTPPSPDLPPSMQQQQFFVVTDDNLMPTAVSEGEYDELVEHYVIYGSDD